LFQLDQVFDILTNCIGGLGWLVIGFRLETPSSKVLLPLTSCVVAVVPLTKDLTIKLKLFLAQKHPNINHFVISNFSAIDVVSECSDLAALGNPVFMNHSSSVDTWFMRVLGPLKAAN